jgi:hypothetical protein
MIGGVNDDKLLGVGQGGELRFEQGFRAKAVAIATDEELGLGAGGEEIEVVVAALDGGDGSADSNKGADARVGAGNPQSDGSAEGEAGEDEREMEFVVEPVEGGAHVVLLTVTVVMFASTQPGAAKVEAQHGQAERVERFHGMEDDFVVQRASEQGMGMADDRGVGGVGGTFIEQGFERTGRAGNEEGADGGGCSHWKSIAGAGTVASCQLPVVSGSDLRSQLLALSSQFSALSVQFGAA